MPSIIMENRDNTYFLIPNVLVERYLTVATHTELKVILWLLKNCAKTTDENELAKYLDITVEALYNAISFWQKEGILIKYGERLSLNIGKLSSVDATPTYSGDVIAHKIKAEPRLALMLKKTEEIFGKLLSPNDVSTLFSLYDFRGLTPEIIILLVEYCVSSGKMGMRYIEKIGISWVDSGIDTIEKAEKQINALNYKKTMEAKVISVIGAGGRALTESEKKYITVWLSEYNFDLDIIKRAYDLTVDKTGKYSITYMNTILRAWNEKGYRSSKDTEKEVPPSKKNNKGEASYNLDESFKNLWTTVHNEK